MSEKLAAGIHQSVEDHYEDLKAIKKYLYDNPEVGGEEEIALNPELMDAIRAEFEEAKKDF